MGEQHLSPREEKFEKGRRTIGLGLAPLVTVVFFFLPLDLPDQQQTLAVVLLGAFILAQAMLKHGLGVVSITKMIRSGFSVDILGAILIIALLPVMVGLLGLGG